MTFPLKEKMLLLLNLKNCKIMRLICRVIYVISITDYYCKSGNYSSLENFHKAMLTI